MNDEPFIISFSGYPGAISSTDDWYFVKDKLIITETTLSPLDIENYDEVDFKDVDTFDFLRVMTSTILA